MSWQYAIVAVAVFAALVVLVRAIRSMMGAGCESGHCGCSHSGAKTQPFADRRAKSTPLVSINVNSPARSTGLDEPPC